VALGEVESVGVGVLLQERGAAIRDVWFPIDCISSVNASLQDGSEAEVAIIGREGLVGVSALVGGTDTTSNDTSVRIAGKALRVPLDGLRHEAGRSSALRLLLQRFAQALLVQASQTSACNRFHSIEQRLGRCLLELHDRVDGDDIAITHERLATVLGTFRPGVTLAAGHLQSEGIIRYTRGRITISDRPGLTGIACECYDTIAAEYERLLGTDVLQDLTDTGDLTDETLREVNSRLVIAAIREQRAREAAEEAISLSTRFLAALSQELLDPAAQTDPGHVRAIVTRLLAAYGGELRVESTAEGGSKVVIVLPGNQTRH